MTQENQFDAVVVGGGPAGLMCAAVAAGRGLSVAVVERFAPALPKKLLITGKGRCNVVNVAQGDAFLQGILRGGRFLMSSLSAFDSADVMDWFQQRGVPLKVERGGRVFPASDRAADIAQALVNAAKDAGARILPGRVRRVVVKDGRVSGVELWDGGVLRCRAAVLATGGLSYPKTGSQGDGYTMARDLGHTVTPRNGSLVPLECTGEDCGALQGLSLRNVTLTFPAQGKPVFSQQGELLFTHFGLSGPLVLSLSARLAGQPVAGQEVSIDLKPALPRDKLDRRVLRDFGDNPNRAFKNALGELLPKRMIPLVIGRSGVDPDKKIHDVTAAERGALVGLLKDFRLTLSRPRPVEEAIVTAGGVDCREIYPKTMMSRRVQGLYFAGEIIDADGETGGYNLGIAFATGHAAGTHLLAEEEK